MNRDDFLQTIGQAGRPVVVDFWAAWCGPCRASKPVLEKVAGEFAGKVDFLTVDADQSRELLEHYRIFGIPTVLAFVNGQEAGRVTGAQGEASYRLVFQALAEGRAVKAGPTPLDRSLRLGAGALLAAIGVATGSWLALAAGAVVAFLGIYDRCPVWAALTRLVRRS